MPKFLSAILAILIIPLLGGTPIDPSQYDHPVKLACVGDSITQGVGTKGGQSWPTQLQAMLGDSWKVGSFGLSGTKVHPNTAGATEIAKAVHAGLTGKAVASED
jgi:lysophospholipase L1-like esterase